MPIRIAINGFGRIGRAALKCGLSHPGLTFVAINDLSAPSTLAHLLTYDSVFPKFSRTAVPGDGILTIDGKKIFLSAERDPALLPWKKHAIDIVLECTGRFTNSEDAQKHIAAGAKKVIVSAPVKGAGVPTYVIGVNADAYQGEAVINNGSCTTNCIAPVADVMTRTFGIVKALMSTIHAVTAEQNLVDSSPPGAKKGDLRRARAAYQNIVPTSTGAAIATTEVIPSLRDHFDGLAFRVPIQDVSLTDFVFLLKKKTTVEQINTVLRAATKEKKYKGLLGVTDEPLVSSDFIGSTYSAIVDLSLTRVIDGDFVKLVAWYDNEWAYAQRLVELAAHIGKWKNKRV